MGSPAAANALEMAAANGARQVILFGACGGVDREVQVGDLLVPTGAIRGEGTSRYYAPDDQPAVCDPELTSILLEEASRRESPRVHHGMVYTTDASYRQGPEIYGTRNERILGVECECAAAAIVGSHLGLRVAALFFCTDNITLPQENDHPYRGLGDERVRRGFDAGLEAVMAALAGSHPGQ
jgi:uridine phosphorylase